jgi:hypothetical protein
MQSSQLSEGTGERHREMRCLAGAQPPEERVLGVTDDYRNRHARRYLEPHDYSNILRQSLVPPIDTLRD